MDVIIVGGGLAGLVCANRLHESGVSCRILEAADAVGGRVRTDEVDGFLLDRGFQVFLTAYPEAKSVLDYPSLDLKSFEPGALIRMGGNTERLVDPWRRPQHMLATAFSGAGTLGDKLRVAGLRSSTAKGTLRELYERDEKPTVDLLKDRGFSDMMIKSFFRPFFGGVFLDSKLETSSRLFDFVFRMFSEGEVVLPAAGMEEISRQLASRLPDGTIQSNTEVKSLEGQELTTGTGEKLSADVIVLATLSPFAKEQLGGLVHVDYRQVKCAYFSSDKPPYTEPILMLNGDGKGPINNLCVPSQVSAKYAPAGKSLISVTCLDLDATLGSIVTQLTEWFGNEVSSWQHLKTYDIRQALPAQVPPILSPVEKTARIREGAYACGDYLDTASINGAMSSGRRCAEAIISDR